MKKILWAVVAVVCSMQLSLAQTSDTTSSVNEILKLTVPQHREILMQTRHQFRLGSTFIGYSFLGNNLQENVDYDAFIPTLSLEYSYRVVEFLELGAYAVYDHVGYIQKEPNYNFRESNDILSLAVFARYSWFNRRYVQFYSSVGVGTSIAFYSSNSKEQTSLNSNSATCLIIPEFTPFGVRFGGRFFGYVEPVAISARGMFFNLGVGYRF